MVDYYFITCILGDTLEVILLPGLDIWDEEGIGLRLNAGMDGFEVTFVLITVGLGDLGLVILDLERIYDFIIDLLVAVGDLGTSELLAVILLTTLGDNWDTVPDVGLVVFNWLRLRLDCDLLSLILESVALNTLGLLTIVLLSFLSTNADLDIGDDLSVFRTLLKLFYLVFEKGDLFSDCSLLLERGMGSLVGDLGSTSDLIIRRIMDY